jgi:hypothetical protein
MDLMASRFVISSHIKTSGVPRFSSSHKISSNDYQGKFKPNGKTFKNFTLKFSRIATLNQHLEGENIHDPSLIVESIHKKARMNGRFS